MPFSVFMLALGGYAVVLLAAVLVLECTRAPVPQPRPLHRLGQSARLRGWPRSRRDCVAGHERGLPLRAARQAVPARRRRSAPRSCRR